MLESECYSKKKNKGLRRPSKTIQGQSQCVDGVGGVAVRQVRFVIELGVGVRGQTKTERGNLDACQFKF